MEMMDTGVLYANVIVDISLEKLDKTFQYLVPGELRGEIAVGMQVDVPFGRRTMTGYVLELSDKPECEVSRIRPLKGITKGSVPVESQLIALAAWMRRNYGSTMNQALKTVLPVKRAMRRVEKKSVELALSGEEAVRRLALLESRHSTARARLLRELIAEGALDYALVTGKLSVSAATIRSMEQQGILRVTAERTYRNPVEHLKKRGYHLTLNDEQQRVVDTVQADWEAGVARTYLLMGVTGSGKTEVYMELIARVIAEGKQAILLIPEIALTYQTVMRFYNRFGERVSIMNSRLSAGERFDQLERAKAGDIDIMIGPRSALFTPFARLGLIIIDEEHETSYKSEQAPRYHAREVAIERAEQNHASVILGSATPSVASYYQVQQGNYALLTLEKRIDERPLPECEVVDMRQELRAGNRSILSERLQELMEQRLAKGQQTMLFLNRRGMSGFISCRACGYVVKCPHCDVSLSLHGGKRLVCHYCGYEETEPAVCPVCKSRYLGAFKAGTEKIELLVQKRFPGARILRMDFDTTRTKDSYEKILQAFANREADILIGTQMIVKGHDFPGVTLVGVLAADLSLYVSDFHSAERTFQLLTQAVGRAGRGDQPGQAVIQTYDPENFAVLTACRQDYKAFYGREIAYRELLHYPPVFHMLVIHAAGRDREALERGTEALAGQLAGWLTKQESAAALVGPADASVAKVRDIYYQVIYLKAKERGFLLSIKDETERLVRETELLSAVTIQYDLCPD
ncbi:MAG: primosomal protein N' [Muribaculaceae bacterium]|nr:primosomal protein N' [Roseburia sp.]MCM1430282.1 primosomal protein N' [Muribaculaceae bacterium]MCM1492609.1 primosomal protein N' [Muribaculaceae bacterium]